MAICSTKRQEYFYPGPEPQRYISVRVKTSTGHSAGCLLGTKAMWAAQEAVKGVSRSVASLDRTSWNGMPAPLLTGRMTLGKLPLRL